MPIEITADGETRFEGGVAIAEENVVINYGDMNIYCDYAQYNPQTRDVLLRGNVRIYRPDYSFTGERAVYNLETRRLRAADFAGSSDPVLFSGENISSLSGRAFQVKNGTFTTHDSARPDYRFRAKSVRIYPDDRIIFSNVTLQVGRVPVFWWPYLYQPLRDDFAFTLAPGYSDLWGAYLLTSYSFPISENVGGRFHLDLRADRGVAVGFDSRFTFGKDNKSWGEFRSYLADDQATGINTTSLARGEIDSTRYRVAYQSKAYISEDVSAIVDFNLLSDEFFLEDFFRSEFRTDPQPDNVFALTKWSENYTLTGIVRGQVNSFQETTERLPEVVLDMKRQPFFKTPLFYEGEVGIANLSKRFADSSDLADYDSIRADTFHQLLYPRTYGGWLSIVPRLGFRATHYTDTGYYTTDDDSLFADDAPRATKEMERLVNEGAETRFSVLAGIESSFKFSKTWEEIQTRTLGLDGLRHIVQPYTNFSFVSDPGVDRSRILQFDRLIPSTQLNPIDFPQFTSVDSIDEWTIWRMGVRNRLQTRRDDLTINWLELDTYFDINIDNPYYDSDFSNVFNRLKWSPLPWVAARIDSQLPLLDSGFTEVNTTLNFMVTSWQDLSIGHRYLDGNPLFQDSNLVAVGGYTRFNEHWGFSWATRYEMDDSVLESQRYTIHRDLTSWVASLGAILRDNRGEEEFGFLLTFTLKDFPQLSLPLDYDPQGSGNE